MWGDAAFYVLWSGTPWIFFMFPWSRVSFNHRLEWKSKRVLSYWPFVREIHLCEGNTPLWGKYTSCQKALTRGFNIFFVVSLDEMLVHSRVGRDLRHHDVHLVSLKWSENICIEEFDQDNSTRNIGIEFQLLGKVLSVTLEMLYMDSILSSVERIIYIICFWPYQLNVYVCQINAFLMECQRHEFHN